MKKAQQKLKIVILAAILGLSMTLATGYLKVGSVNANDWYRYGFPVGWINYEGTGEEINVIFTFYSPIGFTVDSVAWFIILAAVSVLLIRFVSYSAL